MIWIKVYVEETRQDCWENTCVKQIPPIMANSKDGHYQNNKYFDNTTKKL